MKHSILFRVGQHFPATCSSFTRQKFSIACVGIKKFFSSQTKVYDWKVLLGIQCCVLCCFFIVNEEMGEKLHFYHNKDHFGSCLFILTRNFTKNSFFGQDKKFPFICIKNIVKNDKFSVGWEVAPYKNTMCFLAHIR